IRDFHVTGVQTCALPISYQGYEFDVLVNDSLSGFGDIWMAKGLEVLGWDEVGVAGPGHDPRRIYAYIPEKGRQTAKALMSVKAHLILLCRETLMEEGEGKTRITYPAPELPGSKLPRELPGWLDGVVFGKIQGIGANAKRLFLTEAEGKTIAGIRAPEGRRLPKLIPADYGLLIKYMMGDDDAYRALGGTPPPKKLQKETVGLPPTVSTSTNTTKEYNRANRRIPASRRHGEEIGRASWRDRESHRVCAGTIRQK